MKQLVIPVVALLNKKNEVLVASRPKGAFKEGKLELPGGKMEANEFPKDTAIREMEEEIGVKIQEKDLEEATFICNPFPEIDRFCVVLVYICRKWQGDPSPMEKQKLKWVPLSKIEDIIPEFLENNEEMLLRIRTLAAAHCNK